ncbi:hypothetical protein TWF718_010480 [Orbilia javanica]|uniref:F-box domain-containing protein n=1 Tax=Orbilia javanica TaxID=47235 RepID=A0AAN8RA36_9PEZI
MASARITSGLDISDAGTTSIPASDYRPTLETIPIELLTEILGYLKHNKNHLCATSLVSKKLHVASTPLLYETVILKFSELTRESSPQYDSLTCQQHRAVHHVRVFGLKGYYRESRSNMHEADLQKRDYNFRIVSWLMLGVLRQFKFNQLREFVWHTDVHLMDLIARDLKAFQKSLKGLWIARPGPQPDGALHNCLFEMLEQDAFELNSFQLVGFDRPGEFPRGLRFFVSLKDQLTTFIFHPTDRSFTRSLKARAHLWEYQYPGKTMKFSNVKFLSLNIIDDDFFSKVQSISKFFDINKLRTLHLGQVRKITRTLGILRKAKIQLKEFHLTGIVDPDVLDDFLASFSGLQELRLDVECDGDRFKEIVELKTHSATLLRLFTRIQDKRFYSPGGQWFIRLLQENYVFPQLMEIGLSGSFDYLDEIRAGGKGMPKLQLLWIMAHPRNWMDGGLEFSELHAFLRPLFRKTSDIGPRWPFVAIGTGTGSLRDWPKIFELCESVTISGEIATTLSYVTHRDLFDHNPDLTLLQSASHRLPWQEEREFTKSQPKSDFDSKYYF